MTSAFRMRAVNMAPPSQVDACRQALAILADPDLYIEIRTLPYANSFVAKGDELDSLCSFIDELSNYQGVYFSLNPLSSKITRSARKEDIAKRRWLLIDIDRVKDETNKDQSATDAERAKCREMATTICNSLAGKGWPIPVTIDSGNGYHLLYRIDLPCDDLTDATLRAVIHKISDMFSTPEVEIDRAVHNRSRISKLPGTWVRKGENTTERPHRMSSIVYAPSPPSILTFDQLHSFLSPNAKTQATKQPEPVENVKPEPTSELEQFVDNAFSGRAISVPNTPIMDRARAYLKKIPGAVSGQQGHTNTFVAALKVIRGFDLNDDEAYVVLSEWNETCSPPWTERELRHKIADAQKGSGERGNLLNENKHERNGKPPDKDECRFKPGDKVILLASEVPPKRVKWLWQDRIPAAKMTTFAGMGGLGKSFVSCDIAARISTGRDWPDSSPCETPGSVLYISGEDDPDDTLVPRLIEAKADLNKVAFLKGEWLDKYYLADLELLEVAWRQLGNVRLIVIDPPTNYLGETDDHKNAELRSLISPFKEWCKDREVAMVFITHVNKGSGGKVSAMMRVMGSVAWVNAVRSAHIFTRDPADPERRLFIGMKNNNGRERKGLSYRILSANENDPGGPARIEWLGDVDITADEAVSGDTKPRKVAARDWLIAAFKLKLEWDSDELFKAAREEGVSRDSIFDAKAELGLPKAKKRTDMDGSSKWVWWVPADWPYLKDLESDDNESGSGVQW